MISASLNRCKGMEDQVGDFLKQLATSGRFQSALNGRQGAFQLIE